MMQVTATLDSLFAPATPQQPVADTDAFAQLVSAKLSATAGPQDTASPTLQSENILALPGTGAPENAADAFNDAFNDAFAMLFGTVAIPTEIAASTIEVPLGEPTSVEIDQTGGLSTSADTLALLEEAVPTAAIEPAPDVDLATEDIAIDAPEQPAPRLSNLADDTKPQSNRTTQAVPLPTPGEPQPIADTPNQAHGDSLTAEPASDVQRGPTEAQLALLTGRSQSAAPTVQPLVNPLRPATRTGDLTTPSIESNARAAEIAAGDLSVDQPKTAQSTTPGAPAETVLPQSAAAARPVAPTIAPQAEAPLDAPIDPLLDGVDPDGPLRFGMPALGDTSEPGAAPKPLSNASAFQTYLQNAQTAVNGLGIQIAHARQEGLERLQVKLSPEELGSVDITISVDDSKTTRVAIMVERAETLDLLSRDARQLERVLQAQGIDLGGELHLGLREEQAGRDHANAEQGHADRNHVVIEPGADDVQAPVRLVADGLLNLVI